MSLQEVLRLPKGNAVLLCHYGADDFVVSDAVRVLGIVEMWREGQRLHEGRLIVIDPPPQHFKQEVVRHYGNPWYPLGRSIGLMGYRDMSVRRMPYSRPPMPRGFAVHAYTLGLMRDSKGAWSRYWLLQGINDL